MPTSDSAHQYSQMGVRLLSLYFITRGLWLLISNLLGSIPVFDPNYLGHYFYTQMLNPLVGIALGSLLYVLAPILGRRLSK
jgi:hypothetical protein|tara:strand:+ start:390 stop:632 length:243 start_codon:yes stop_codon:yes gene_type:complete